MANIPPPSPAFGGGDANSNNDGKYPSPPPPPQYVSVPPPSDYSYQTAPPPIPLVPPPPPSYPVSTHNVETPPPLPPPTAPHYDVDDGFGPSAPPPPPPPEPPVQPPPPPPAPPAETKVEFGDSLEKEQAPGVVTNAGSSIKKMSMDELPAYIGFFTLGVLLGLAFSLFSFTFNCCMPSLKNKAIRRNFFNAGCAIGSVAQVGLAVFLGITIKNAIKRAFDKINRPDRRP